MVGASTLYKVAWLSVLSVYRVIMFVGAREQTKHDVEIHHGAQCASGVSAHHHRCSRSMLNLTHCLHCGHRSCRSEPFFDLSLEVVADTSLTHLLRAFSQAELMGGSEKHSCPSCTTKQEAHRSLVLAKLPPILVVHLKRFRFIESAGEFRKIKDRVTFPMHIRLMEEGNASAAATSSTSAAASAAASASAPVEKLYALSSVVVHIGSSLRHGHYVSLVNVSNQWVCFDDDDIHLWSQDDVKTTYGSVYTGEKNGHLDGYLLFYSQIEDDAAA